MNDFDIVKRVIDEWDPVDLLSSGSPGDEYEDETKDIVDHLDTIYSAEELAEVIHEVFIRWFGSTFSYAASTVQKCYPIAKVMWDRLY